MHSHPEAADTLIVGATAASSRSAICRTGSPKK
jgi:hypothetical protein